MCIELRRARQAWHSALAATRTQPVHEAEAGAGVTSYTSRVSVRVAFYGRSLYVVTPPPAAACSTQPTSDSKSWAILTVVSYRCNSYRLLQRGGELRKDGATVRIAKSLIIAQFPPPSAENSRFETTNRRRLLLHVVRRRRQPRRLDGGAGRPAAARLAPRLPPAKRDCGGSGRLHSTNRHRRGSRGAATAGRGVS